MPRIAATVARASSNFDLPGPVGKVHRPADVDHEQRRQIRRLAKLARVDPIGARERLPVDVLQVVAGPIVAILAELRAVAVKRTAMQALPQTFDRRPRHQLEIAKRLQLGRRDDVRTGHD